jgi:ribosomal protein L11 methyltransferase
MTSTDPNQRGWTALVLRVPRHCAEVLAAELATIGRGAETRRVDHRNDEIRAFLHTPDQAIELRGWAERRLATMGVDVSACSFELEEVEDGRWVERYQAALRPFRFGTRFTVHPRGRVEIEDGREPLLLVPGRAFGTGEHATTQLCAEQLERRVAPGDAWFDLGCGTGILLLVAHSLGATRLLGHEIDPAAVEVAREVLRQNGVADAVSVYSAGLENAPRARWDGAICNIGTTFVRMHVEELADLPRTGGLLIVSGILVEDIPELAAAFAAAGLLEIDRATREPWAVLTFERP